VRNSFLFGAKAANKIAMGDLNGPAAHRGPGTKEAAFSPWRESGLGNSIENNPIPEADCGSNLSGQTLMADYFLIWNGENL